MDEAARAVRVFGTDGDGPGAERLGERRIVVAPAVERAEGGPLSAYSAHFERGERAALPAPYAEVWVVLRGRLRLGDGDAAVTVAAGEFAHVPELAPGAVEALEDTTLVCVSVPAH